MTTAPYNKDMGDDYRIKILEQQLAERDAQLLKNADILGEAADALDHKDKQIVMLRCTIEEVSYVLADNQLWAAWSICNTSLTATQDLAGCIICDAKPVIFSDFQTEPLYKARTK